MGMMEEERRQEVMTLEYKVKEMGKGKAESKRESERWRKKYEETKED